MTQLARMALRNLLRQYRRTLFSMVSVIVGVFIVIAGRGFVDGLQENMVRAQINATTGDVLAVPSDYPLAGVRHPVDHLVPITPELRSWLDAHSVAWTDRVYFSPRAIVSGDSIRVRAIGFRPESDEQVFSRAEWHVDGVTPTTAAEGILVGSGVARVLKVGVGDLMTLEGRTTSGALNAISVPVAGLLTSNNPVVDGLSVFVPRDLADSFLLSDGLVSHLSMKLAGRGDADAASAGLAEQLGEGARVSTWAEEAQPLIDAQDIRRRMLDILALAMFGIAATGIANTVLMAAYERTREIGTMRALGLTRRGVILMFVLEGVFLGVLGSALGAMAGSWLILHYSVDGIDMSGLIPKDGAAIDVPMSTMLYTSFSPTVVAFTVTLGVVVSILASFYPAWSASNLVPADAVRAE